MKAFNGDVDVTVSLRPNRVEVRPVEIAATLADVQDLPGSRG
jgi:hypothetical protein